MCTRPVPQYSADDQSPLTPDSSNRTATPVPAAYVTRSPVIQARAAVLSTFSRCRRAAVPPSRRCSAAARQSLLCVGHAAPPHPGAPAEAGSPGSSHRPTKAASLTQLVRPIHTEPSATTSRRRRRPMSAIANGARHRSALAFIPCRSRRHPHVQDMRAGYPRSSGVSWRQMLLKTTPRMGSSAIVIACSRPISSSSPPMRWASEPM